jgi:hypothetical protein
MNNLKPFQKGRGKTGGKQKKLVSYTLDLLESEGYKNVTPEQIKQVYTILITLTQERLTALAKDTETPMLYRIVAKEILGLKGFEIIERMLDRAHGKATTPVEHSGSVETKIISVKNDELDEFLKSLSEKENGRT